MIFTETIAAIATPPGVGGIGVVRVSGPAAEAIAHRLFRPSRHRGGLVSHHLCHGWIVAPESQTVLDEVLVTLMRAPCSYTGEDILEIQGHGGPLVLRSLLDAVLGSGARPARPGEFTQRAFLNDRLDLVQAEAVLDTIGARTGEGLAAAMDRLRGNLSRHIEALRARTVDLLAAVEAAIDFSAEEGVVPSPGHDLAPFTALITDLQSLAATYRRGRILREGLSLVIAGRPNVGKSSLLNRLLGERRAIVTDLPGTTRDFIEETLDLEGIPVRLTDTAGIRSPRDPVEREGIALVWERLSEADATLLLLDGSTPMDPEEARLLAALREKPLLVVINKGDLPQRIDLGALAPLLPSGTAPPLRISAKTGAGMDDLRQAIVALAAGGPAAPQGPAIAHLHQRLALDQAAAALTAARDGLEMGLSPELAALEIREALEAFGQLTGRTANEEVLARIFATFCLGK